MYRRPAVALVAVLVAATVLAVSPASALGPNAVLTDAGCYTTPMVSNDDLSVSNVPIGFTIDFFGASYSQLHVNNNGNVTFDEPLETYTPFPISTTGTKIIAPFFGDVDTRGDGSDVTRWGAATYNGRPALCISWAGVGVGYFVEHVDKLNNFQLVLVDRSDVAPGDFDIVFNYDRIQWETGDASGGRNGLGGASARAGWSNGDTESFELAGSAVDGGLLDSNPTTGLVHNSLNSGGQLGRYVFSVRNGVVLPPQTNAAPTVLPGGPYSVAEGSMVTLTALGLDGDGDSLTYTWDLDGDGVFESSGASVGFSAAALDGPTSRTVSVRVDDGHGGSATANATVAVLNVAPTATFVVPTTVDVFSPIPLALMGANDPAAADVLSFAFDCGSGFGPAGASSSASCPTSQLGTRTVRGRVADDDGGSTEYTATVAVVDRVAPTGSCAPWTNPGGKNAPNANAGFRLVSAADDYAIASTVIVDGGSPFVSGELANGSVVKLTQSPGGTAADVRPGAGLVVAHVTTLGEPALRIRDSSGNTTLVSCGPLPPS